MGFLGRKKEKKYSFSYHSRSAQADAARQLCDLLNGGGRRMPRKARERGPGYQFKYRDSNSFEHFLCIDENGIVVPVADMYEGGGHRGAGAGFQGIGGGMMGGFDPQQMMAMQRRQFQQPRQMQMQMMQAQMQQIGRRQQQQQQQLPWDMELAQQKAEYQQRGRGHDQPHAQPQAQPQRAPAHDLDRPPFRNPFKTSLPQGSYGKREYVPGQERIKVSKTRQSYDNPATSWDMMQSLNRLRRQNGQG